jgi:sortase A
MSGNRTDRVVRGIERGLVVVGATCLLWVGSTSVSAIVYQIKQGISLERLDRSLDSIEAVRAPHDVETPLQPSAPIGRLEIPRIGLSVVVAEGDDEKTLKVAVGHLPDTPLPWQEGNTALAGHRDTFFRPLRRIQPGDEIRLATRRGTFGYRVIRQMVVEPDELWVLDSSPSAGLTLITCYPFDYVGPAPRRFIVHAERMANVSERSHTTATQEDDTR